MNDPTLPGSQTAEFIASSGNLSPAGKSGLSVLLLKIFCVWFCYVFPIKRILYPRLFLINNGSNAMFLGLVTSLSKQAGKERCNHIHTLNQTVLPIRVTTKKKK